MTGDEVEASFTQRGAIMTQLTTPIARSGSRPDVYSALLVVAAAVLLVGIIFIALRNIEQTTTGGQTGGPLTYIER